MMALQEAPNSRQKNQNEISESTLLPVYIELALRHSRTGMAQQMAEGLCRGATDAILEMEASAADLAVDLRRAQETQAQIQFSTDE